MINIPANDMGPVQLEMAAREIAEAFGAKVAVVVGDALLDASYPAVHAVGRAAVPARAPRMIELSWGEAGHPLVALVGKGVVFDTGGLDHQALGRHAADEEGHGRRGPRPGAGPDGDGRRACRCAWSCCCPVVENAISGDAMRPGDVLASRKGLTIEVGNTDAEGRLILADALTRAARAGAGADHRPGHPDRRGARGAGARRCRPSTPTTRRWPARSAAAARGGWPIRSGACRSGQGYETSLDSDIADIKNDPDAWAQAGSVTAALFLQRFAPQGPWAHFDIFAWNPRNRPGFPVGAEAQAIRAAYAVLKARYA